MTLDSSDTIAADFDILDAIGVIHEALTQAAMEAGSPVKALIHWVAGHRDPPDDPAEQACLLAMALDLDHFTPSMSGSTAMARHLRRFRPKNALEQAAAKALEAAQFRLVRIEGHRGPSLINLTDLATGEKLVLLDNTIAPTGIEMHSAMRLCPLESGRHVLISPRFLLDDRLLSLAMEFVKPGRALGHGYRCAAALYRQIARGGYIPMPLMESPFEIEDLVDLVEGLLPTQRMVIELMALTDPAEQAEFEAEIRRTVTFDDVIDIFGTLGNLKDEAPPDLRAANLRLAEIVVETMALRERARLAGFDGVLDAVAAAIDGFVASGEMDASARRHCDRERARLAFADAGRRQAGAERGELDRAIQRILALRAKTVEQGCTEDEAMAAAAKVAELLERYDLTLDEISLKNSAAESVVIETGRRRRNRAFQDCVPDIAAFCDCRTWSEKGADDTLRQIYFGLKADVEAARFLHETIETMFETESDRFRNGAIYRAEQAGSRRLVLNSFQLGLGRGIGEKLRRLAAERHAKAAEATKSSGFDLVTVKQSVLDEEMAKLGLAFKAVKARSSRVHSASYQAGRAAGAQFEPYRRLGT